MSINTPGHDNVTWNVVKDSNGDIAIEMQIDNFVNERGMRVNAGKLVIASWYLSERDAVNLMDAIETARHQ